MIGMQKKGFTIVEILIFVTIISIVFVVSAQITTVSLQTSRTNERRIIAQHLAEGIREWLKGQKDADFTTFVTTRMGTWCFNTEPIDTWSDAVSGPCQGYTLQNAFKRSVVLVAQADNTQVVATILVEWQDGSRSFQVPLKTVFALTE